MSVKSDLKLRDVVLRMHKSGVTVAEIADLLDVSCTLVIETIQSQFDLRPDDSARRSDLKPPRQFVSSKHSKKFVTSKGVPVKPDGSGRSRVFLLPTPDSWSADGSLKAWTRTLERKWTAKAEECESQRQYEMMSDLTPVVLDFVRRCELVFKRANSGK